MDNIKQEDNLLKQEVKKEDSEMNPEMNPLMEQKESTQSKRGRKKQNTEVKQQPLSEEKGSQVNDVLKTNSEEKLCQKDIEQMILFLVETLELMYWTKAKQITTPDSAKMSTELDNIFRHKTADMPKLIKEFFKEEK